MKVTYTGTNGRLKVELEAESQVDLFQQLSEFQEIFDETECGK